MDDLSFDGGLLELDLFSHAENCSHTSLGILLDFGVQHEIDLIVYSSLLYKHSAIVANLVVWEKEAFSLRGCK